jgi:hypothetical protein
MDRWRSNMENDESIMDNATYNCSKFVIFVILMTLLAYYG